MTLAPVTSDKLSVKNTMAVPSLSRLSPSSNTDSRRGTPRLLNTATTAIGSVAAINAPNTNAYCQVKFCSRCSVVTTGVRITVVNATAAATPGTASDAMANRLRQNSRNSM